MPLMVSGLREPVDAAGTDLAALVAEALHVKRESIASARLYRRALDARKKNEIHFELKALVSLSPEAERRVLARGDRNVTAYAPPLPEAPVFGQEMPSGRVVVAGLGPAGLFCALTLAQRGYRPLVLERGRPVEERAMRVESFFSGGALDPECNVMFGEGGAGTFSDGKLTSRSKDARGQLVLETLARFGAPEEILTDAKPHIGTDKLRLTVSNMRREIERLGGEVRFSARLTDVFCKDGALTGVLVNETERIDCAALVLAAGQGARDTVRMLLSRGVRIEKKPFAAGVRAEHPQRLIDRAQFGAMAGHRRLGAASYALTARSGERGVYTFCMCPGGQVIASSSSMGEVVVNGMSDYARAGENANAAVVVQVRAEDCPDGPLGGIAFCENLERAAFSAGGGDYRAPGCRVEDFLKQKTPRFFGGVVPSYRPGVKPVDLWKLLPDFMASGVADGLAAFSHQLSGYGLPDAVLTGVETRTSAPFRIVRDEGCQAVTLNNLYPVGEGAGYAGGIVSAAIDGLRAADALTARFHP